MVSETWIMAPTLALMGGANVNIPVAPLRLLRLLRLTRMARLMRSVPELVTMTKGLAMASRAVLSSLLMVLMLIYTFAIILHVFMKEEDDVNAELNEALSRSFKSVPRCMWTLLVDGTFMDNAGLVLTRLLFDGRFKLLLATFFFLAFILLSAMTVMNMLIGVICEVVSAVAQGEKDAAAVALVKESILMDLKKFDDGKGNISKHGLMEVMEDPQSKAVLQSLNVDRLFLLQLQAMLFPTPEAQVSIKGVLELMLMCRGDSITTVQTLASGLLYLSGLIQNIERHIIHGMTIGHGHPIMHKTATA
jgi:hypothetical protein